MQGQKGKWVRLPGQEKVVVKGQQCRVENPRRSSQFFFGTLVKAGKTLTTVLLDGGGVLQVRSEFVSLPGPAPLVVKGGESDDE